MNFAKAILVDSISSALGIANSAAWKWETENDELRLSDHLFFPGKLTQKHDRNWQSSTRDINTVRSTCGYTHIHVLWLCVCGFVHEYKNVHIMYILATGIVLKGGGHYKIWICLHVYRGKYMLTFQSYQNASRYTKRNQVLQARQGAWHWGSHTFLKISPLGLEGSICQTSNPCTW